MDVEEKPPSAFKDVSLTVDGYVLDARKLRSIEADGTLVYEEPKPPQANETETLQRIWDEVPGGFLDLTEEGLRADGDEFPEPEEEVKVEEGEKGGLMSAEDMEALRTEVCSNLNDARNELWFVFELAKTLAASSGMTSHPPPDPIPASAPQPKKKKGAAAAAAASAMASAVSTPLPSGPESELVLPAGTYSTTPGTASEPPVQLQAEKLETALRARSRALDECSNLIDAAVSELELMSNASERFASDLDQLRGKELWAIVPKPEFGRASTAPNARARDVVIPYALDEAPAALHARSLAAFDLDPSKPEMAFGARSFMRLRFLLRRGADAPTYSSAVYDASKEEGTDVCAVLRAAQAETLDEDLFHELRAEALRVDGARVEATSFTLKVGKDKLTAELYDSRSPPSTPRGELAEMLLATARLNMLHGYRRRKARIVTGTGAPHPPALVTLLSLVQFMGALDAIRPTLETIVGTLKQAGLSAHLAERHACADPTVSECLMTARAKYDVLGVVFSLDLAPGASEASRNWGGAVAAHNAAISQLGGYGPSTGGSGGRGFLSVNLTAPAAITVVVPGTSFPVKDLEALGGIVAEHAAGQIAPLLFRGIKGQPGAFYDELERCVVLGDRGPLTLEIPAPHTSLIATVDGERYDSATAGVGLEDWLKSLAGENGFRE